MNFWQILGITASFATIISLGIGIPLFIDWLKKRNEVKELKLEIQKLKKELEEKIAATGEKTTHDLEKKFRKVLREVCPNLPVYLDNLPQTTDPDKVGLLNEALDAMSRYSHAEAIAKFQKALPLASDDNERCAILNLIGLNQCKMGNFKEAKNTFQTIINIAEAIRLDEALVVGLGNIGLVFHTLGDAENALAAHSHALTIDQKIGDIHGQAKQFINLGNVFFLKGDFEKAMDSFKEALRINENIRSHSIQANALGNIGILYKDQGNLDRSLEFLEKALDEAKQTGELEIYTNWLGNLAVVTGMKGEHQQSLQRLVEALNIYERIDNREGIAYQIYHMGNIYFEMNEFEKALDYFLRACTIFEKIGSELMIKGCNDNIALTKQKLAEQGK
ncbi:tetratricopeptide repeat protein [candidate division WOR-3 bacterium]|nr:tetratricopeptide repeat protein [candidate division WOR-3 bacterium]